MSKLDQRLDKLQLIHVHSRSYVDLHTLVKVIEECRSYDDFCYLEGVLQDYECQMEDERSEAKKDVPEGQLVVL